MSGNSYNNDPIVTELNAITTAVAKSSSTTAKLINSEVDRLKGRQSEIIEARFGQNRIIDLNRSQLKRNAAYMKFGILTVVCLGIILIVRLFGNMIPEAVLSIVYIILVSVCVFYGLIVYTDVSRRESTNFDRYEIPPPAIDLSEDEKNKRKVAAIKAGNLLASNDDKICSGQGCCAYDQAYSGELNKCENCPIVNNVPTYYIEATKQCGVCSGSDRYMRATKSCRECSTGTTYNDTSQSCV
jgi:hypothetical protein